MRVLVCPPTLEIGGSQINAIELGAAFRDLGHEVLVFAEPGPLTDLIDQLGLEFVPLRVPDPPRPSWHTVAAFRRVVTQYGIDLVHAYESPTAIEAFLGARALAGAPVITSVMSMMVPRRFPRSFPLIVGTRQLLEEAVAARNGGGGPVALLEPPIDTDHNHPGVDSTAFRREHGLEDGSRTLVIVSRLELEMKLEGVERAMDAVALLPSAPTVQLVVVGGGGAYAHLRARAAALNRRLGRPAVVLTGPLLDPRPAYATADVVLGMGGSILRGMSTGRPAICLGERGFSKPVTPATIDWFLRHGFYGLGDGDLNPARLAGQLQELLALAPQRRRELGMFSRKVITDGFDLRSSARRLEQLYRQVRQEALRGPRILADVARTARWAMLIKAKQQALGVVKRVSPALADAMLEGTIPPPRWRNLPRLGSRA